eukprot:SAG31_NODE_19485_length_600_cov_1.161677_1_plen_156_part_10
MEDGLNAIDVQTSTITKPATETGPETLCVDFNAYETRACTGEINGIVRMYDTTSRPWVQLWEAETGGFCISLRFSCDGTRVVFGGVGMKLTVYDAETGKIDKSLDLQMCPTPMETGGVQASIAVSAVLLVGSGGANTPDAKCVKIWLFADLDRAPH